MPNFRNHLGQYIKGSNGQEKRGINMHCKCGKIFYVPNHRKDTAKFCSINCSSRVELKKCLICKKEFKPFNKNQFLCSCKCLGIYNRKPEVIKRCMICQKEYRCKTHYQRNTSRVCSRICQGKLIQKLGIAYKNFPTTRGERWTPELREKLSGKNNYNWQGGITNKNEKFRKRPEYKILMETIKAMDNYTCQMCKGKGGKLNTNHIKLFSKYPELRMNQNNLITLCEPCHKFIRGKEGQYEKQFYEITAKREWKFIADIQESADSRSRRVFVYN